MGRKEITAPLTSDTVKNLRAGDLVYINGIIYTARDAAHKRMYETLLEGGALPFDINNQVIYYAGPCPKKEGEVIGSCGPTTSGRMDKYTPLLLQKGLKGMIGKGERSQDVIEAMAKYGAVYFAATGGAGALISRSVKKAEVIAYEDLGTEAIMRLEVENFPAIVVIDCYGNNLYKMAKEKWRRY